jgi:hypothetical protein
MTQARAFMSLNVLQVEKSGKAVEGARFDVRDQVVRQVAAVEGVVSDQCESRERVRSGAK